MLVTRRKAKQRKNGPHPAWDGFEFHANLPQDCARREMLTQVRIKVGGWESKSSYAAILRAGAQSTIWRLARA